MNASYETAFFDRLWRNFVIAAPYIWLLVFFLAPFFIIFKISLADPVIGAPPYSLLFDSTRETIYGFFITLDNYRYLFIDDLYWVSYTRSLKIALTATLLCLVFGYPMAYAIAQATPAWRNILLMLVILPFWTSFLLRVFALIGILSNKGLINSLLISIGLIDKPLKLMYTDLAVYIGIVYTYLPFMILPLYANLEKLDVSMREASADLGAKPLQTFWDITLPLSLPGIIAGCLLVFIPALGEFVIPALLGGPDSLMIGYTLYEEFFTNYDWPVSSALATILLLILVIPIMLFQHYQMDEPETSK